MCVRALLLPDWCALMGRRRVSLESNPKAQGLVDRGRSQFAHGVWKVGIVTVLRLTIVFMITDKLRALYLFHSVNIAFNLFI